FFGWGLLTAVSGVFVAPRIADALGQKGGVIVAIGGYGITMALAGLGVVTGQVWLTGFAIVLSGLPSGILNTLFTGVAMSSADPDKPRSVASAGYSFLRWMGGAASAVMVAYLAEWFAP
ncbi:MFS transporter, partial [Streptomyces sp. SID10244]|nr:MFS transporter [Streptomyces sp. SID10244]